MVTALTTIPSGFSIKTIAINGKPESVLVPKRRSSGKKRVSKETKARIRSSLREFKFPVLTAAANAIPALNGLTWLGDPNVGPRSNASGIVKGASFFNAVASPYLGIQFRLISPTSVKAEFVPERLMEGLLPNIGVRLASKFGFFKNINMKLARARVPLRLA